MLNFILGIGFYLIVVPIIGSIVDYCSTAIDIRKNIMIDAYNNNKPTTETEAIGFQIEDEEEGALDAK